MNDRPDAILDAFGAAARERLLQKATPRSFGPGEVIFLSGTKTSHVYVVTGGAVKLTARADDGSEVTDALAFPGELLGQQSLVDDHTETHDAIATCRSSVLALPRSLVRAELDADPDACLAIARALSIRLRWMTTALLDRSCGDAPARMAGRLLDLAAILGTMHGNAIDLDLPVHQGDLAAMAGMCRESACKTLRAFKKQGLLDYRGRRYRIVRPDVLRAIRCAGRASGPSR